MDTIGKIYSLDDASENFGDVLNSISISSSDMITFANNTTGKLMFKIINDLLIVLDNTRKVIRPENYEVDSNEVFTVFTCDIILELLQMGGDELTIVEKRKEHTTIRNGNLILETGFPCPPYC
jgi:hypothetical protein